MWTPENRPKYNRDKLRYPSDLTDEEWSHIEPLIPPAKHGGRKRKVDVREVVNGIMYVLSTGCQWRYVPKDLPPSRRSRRTVPRPLRAGRSSSKRVVRSPPKSTLFGYFDLWNWDGTLDRIHHALYVKCREDMDREASPTACVIDSQSVKSAEKGGPVSIPAATMQARRSRARSAISS
jgi:transposase